MVEVRPIGVLNMEDDGGEDNKVLAVAVGDPKFADMRDIENVDKSTLEQIKYFLSTTRIWNPANGPK